MVIDIIINNKEVKAELNGHFEIEILVYEFPFEIII